jgi:methionine synthase I (cobalamin-dependent)
VPDLLLRLSKDILVVEGGLRASLEREGAGAEVEVVSTLSAYGSYDLGTKTPDARPACSSPAPVTFDSTYLNVMDPELVQTVHERYVAAGAHCGISNTLTANRYSLAAQGLEDQLSAVNRAGMRALRRAGYQHLLAAVGPLLGKDTTADTIAACGGNSSAAVNRETDNCNSNLQRAQQDTRPQHVKQAVTAYGEQIVALAAEFPDALFLSGFTSLGDLRLALEAARAMSDLPVICGLRLAPDGSLASDQAVSPVLPESPAPAQAAAAYADGSLADHPSCRATLEDVLRFLEAQDVSALGFGYGLVPKQLLALTQRLARATKLPLYTIVEIEPSARRPSPVAVSRATDSLADLALQLRQAGAHLIGPGACALPVHCAAIYAVACGPTPAQAAFVPALLAHDFSNPALLAHDLNGCRS